MLKVNLPLLLGCTLFAVVLQAQTIIDYIPNDTPDSRYTLHDNGRVTDTKTGLIWQRCSLGQTWVKGQTPEQDSCTGKPEEYNWEQALQQADKNNFAGYSDWRLPNVEELRSLVAYDRYNPAINSSIFPNISSRYWSSSPNASNGNDAWVVPFYFGNVNSYNRYYSSHAVRLVSSGE